MNTEIDKSNDINKINETCQSSTSPVKKKYQSRFEKDDQSPKGKRWSPVPLPCLLSDLSIVAFEVSRASAPKEDEVL